MARKLASVRKITNIRQHPNADTLDLANIDGWQVVVKQDLHMEGDHVVFFEIDSCLDPEDPRWSFMAKNTSSLNDKRVIRIKTIKLRGEISQGLVLPLSEFPEFTGALVGTDLTEEIGVQKWETKAEGIDAVGTFPSMIRKTDVDRIQNMYDDLRIDHADEAFIPTLKLDGGSCTAFYFSNEEWAEEWGRWGICARKFQVSLETDNQYARAVKNSGISQATMEAINYKYGFRNIALQGEVVGPGMQGNREKFPRLTFVVFDIWLIDSQQYAGPEFVEEICEFFQLPMVTHYPPEKVLEKPLDDILSAATGPSMYATQREGLVFKALNSYARFKAISNKYLLKHGE